MAAEILDFKRRVAYFVLLPTHPRKTMSAPNVSPKPPVKRPAKRKNLAVLGERLNKFLASASALSRRAAEELIVQGRVEIRLLQQ